jgi:hypothetical protein
MSPPPLDGTVNNTNWGPGHEPKAAHRNNCRSLPPLATNSVFPYQLRPSVTADPQIEAFIKMGRQGRDWPRENWKDEWYPHKGAVKVLFSFGFDHSSLICDQLAAQRAQS